MQRAHYHRARSGPGPVPRPAFKAGGAVRSRLEGSTPSPLRPGGTLDGVSATPHPGVDLLLERERELRCIDAAIAAAREGTGRSVVVEGPAGIGKSAVLAAARIATEDGATRFLRARGAELERDFAFGVVRQLFEPMLHEASAAERADLLQGPARLAARVLGLPGGLEEGEAPAAAPDASFAVLHGLYWLCANLAASRPVVLSVDDAHWADASSLRFLAFLMPRLQELRIALLVAARPEAEVEEAHLLATLTADPHGDVVHPAPLSVAAVGRLVEARLGSAPEEAFTAACHRATGGVPFLVRELVEAVGREGMTPDARTAARVEGVGASTARRWIQLRLGRLPAPAARLARAVAVLERAQLPRAAARRSPRRCSCAARWPSRRPRPSAPACCSSSASPRPWPARRPARAICARRSTSRATTTAWRSARRSSSPTPSDAPSASRTRWPSSIARRRGCARPTSRPPSCSRRWRSWRACSTRAPPRCSMRA